MSSSERANSHQVAPSHRSTFMISLESTAQQSTADQARPELSTVELIPDDLQQLLGSNRSSQNQATIVHLNDLHLLLHLLLLHALFLYPSIVHRSSSIVGYIQLYPTICIHPSGQANCVSRKQSVSTFCTPRAQHHHHQHDHQHDHHERAVRASFAVF